VLLSNLFYRLVRDYQEELDFLKVFPFGLAKTIFTTHPQLAQEHFCKGVIFLIF
jgi:hypothetical protein